MKNAKLFAEAIADAKNVRNIALANAKKSLEEAFVPQVQSMLDKKLAEMEEIDENDEKNEGLDNSTQNMEEELESILQELGMDEDPISETEEIDENDDLDENEDLDENDDLEENEFYEMEDEPTDEPIGDMGGEEPEMDADPEMGGEMEGEPQDVTDLTVDQLKDIIFSAVQDVMGGGAEGGEEMEPGLEDDGTEPEMDGGSEEEVDLDELLASLDEDDDVKEGKEWYNAKKAGKAKAMKETTKGVDEGKEWYNAKKAKAGKAKAMKETTKVVETQKELNEAIKVIRRLKESLGSTNLLNAKLLYLNKIFKAKTLTEGQKLKVVAAFDKARTRTEAKTIFESLNETLNSKKSSIRESISKFGFASKASGASAPKGQKSLIVENSTVKRFQELAGIIKSN